METSLVIASHKKNQHLHENLHSRQVLLALQKCLFPSLRLNAVFIPNETYLSLAP